MKNALGEEVTIEHLQAFFKVKRAEYEYAEKNGLKTLQMVIRDAVKKTAKRFEVKLKPGEQQSLF